MTATPLYSRSTTAGSRHGSGRSRSRSNPAGVLRQTLGLRACILAFLLAACLTPPAVRPAGSDAVDTASFPAGTRKVAIGELEGIHLPGRPLVLLFLESGGSITRGGDVYPLAWDLRALGMGLLCVDYRGVGASGGEASAKNLRGDARAAWKEAVRLAGDPKGVVLRGTSLGGLAISCLLDDGAEPGAVVIAAPVRAETAVRRFADEWAMGIEKTLARLLVRRPARTDVVRALARTAAPALVACGASDPYLDDGERALFAKAADRFVAWPDDDHYDAVDRARALLSAERALYLDTFPRLPDIEARLRAVEAVPGAPPRAVLAPSLARAAFDAPSTAAAAALVHPQLENRSSMANWMRTLPPLPLDAAIALVSIDFPVDFFGWTGWVEGRPRDPQRLLAAVRASRRHARVEMRAVRYDWNGGETVRELADRDQGPVDTARPHLARLRLPEDEMLRQGFLLALKAHRIPARPVPGGVQVWRDGWTFIPVP